MHRPHFTVVRHTPEVGNQITPCLHVLHAHAPCVCQTKALVFVGGDSWRQKSDQVLCMAHHGGLSQASLGPEVASPTPPAWCHTDLNYHDKHGRHP